MLPLSPPLNVSVVIPIYNEEANVAELVARVGTAMLRTGKTFALICVDDGSRDGSAAALEAIAAERPWLKPLYLIRNYGQSAALQAGFDAAQGEIIVTLDGDLQNEPDDVPELLKILDERPGGCDFRLAQGAPGPYGVAQAPLGGGQCGHLERDGRQAP